MVHRTLAWYEWKRRMLSDAVSAEILVILEHQDQDRGDEMDLGPTDSI